MFYATLTWPEAAAYMIGVPAGCAAFVILFGLLITERWPWDRR